MLNIFVCHRPYHVLRSVDFLSRFLQKGENVLFLYNIYDLSDNTYKDMNVGFEYEVFFSKVVILDRSDDVPLRKPFLFLKYYKKKIREYKALAQDFGDFDNLYFFSDYEKPVEILVGTFKKNNTSCHNITLIDEGTAAYYIHSSLKDRLIKPIIVKCFNLRYLNHTSDYGRSFLYNKSFASFPDKSVFRGCVKQLPPLDSSLMSALLMKMHVNLDIDKLVFIYVSSLITYTPLNVPIEKEISFLNEVNNIASGYKCKFYIKPHPSQSPSDYLSYFPDDIVIEKSFPIEMLYNENVVIISCLSSSLINASLTNVMAICVSSIFNLSNAKANLEWLPILYPENKTHCLSLIDEICQSKMS